MGRRCRQPVIPPLPRVEGCRCSVKPASRITLRFRIKEIQAFAQIPLTKYWLEVGRQHRATPSPTERSHD
ncbi:hypothetical protein PHAVU_005G154200 [Phaseolus vulgaris]|uniref:Uncharacterized protein n=1 Tax=Phaseolus vulgaris TaxID=3885 RepID=V7C0L3_PHAVU|nr:hypothetical protein PHAVU_005G154200g [Phaseolus vulgaris]ESW22441.1 hypothetical protein PHAVU_005G154200g [Phaseolus vulgaris]